MEVATPSVIHKLKLLHKMFSLWQTIVNNKFNEKASGVKMRPSAHLPMWYDGAERLVCTSNDRHTRPLKRMQKGKILAYRKWIYFFNLTQKGIWVFFSSQIRRHGTPRRGRPKDVLKWSTIFCWPRLKIHSHAFHLLIFFQPFWDIRWHSFWDLLSLLSFQMFDGKKHQV